ncbi:MAG: hypothetical protein JWP97_4095 [Labilithrix sp.]|nr:hypothetical protein [Labilithrix sp.]
MARGTMWCSALLLSLCPGCAVGETARQQVLQQDFLPHLVVALLPFAIIGLVVQRLDRSGPGGAS